MLYRPAYRWLSVVLLAAWGLLATERTHADGESFFYAAKCPVVAGQAWGILQRDGANRPTEPYLSSLVEGESQTGRIASPPLVISVDTIRFTICGHDGQQGGRGENYMALVDNKTGQILLQTPAPGNDAMQQREWDVRDLRGGPCGSRWWMATR
jgi:hypothetical protein